MKGIIPVLMFFLHLVNASSIEVKNILVFSFPGGKSHCFVFKELFKFTWARLKKERPNVEYNFHLIIHNYDINLWTSMSKEYPNLFLYGYGNVNEYEDKFNNAMKLAKDDPIFGYNNFNNAYLHIIRDFLNDKMLEKIKATGIKFDLMMSDVANLIGIFLRRELKIEKKLFSRKNKKK